MEDTKNVTGLCHTHLQPMAAAILIYPTHMESNSRRNWHKGALPGGGTSMFLRPGVGSPGWCLLGWLEEVRGSDKCWAGETGMMKAKGRMRQVEDAQREGTST